MLSLFLLTLAAAGDLDKLDWMAGCHVMESPRAKVEEYEPMLRRLPGRVERIDVAGFKLLIHDRVKGTSGTAGAQ